MSKVFNMVGGGGGPAASIFVTGLSETDTVTATKGSKTLVGKWTQKPNPAIRGLPDGYTQLEYIESSGTQYINSGVSPNKPLKVVSEASFSSSSQDWHVLIAANTNNSSGADGYHVQRSSSGVMGYQYNNNSFIDSISLASDVFYKIEFDAKAGSQNLFVDDTLVASSTDANLPNNTNSLFIFACNSAGTATWGSVLKLKYLSLESNGEILRNFIPAKRNSDSVVGLYDIVNGVFYENAGTGTFVAGAEVPQTVGVFLIKPIRDFGTWTVTATDGTDTYTQDVLVDVITVYEIEITKKLYLYRDGDECEDVTGGWLPLNGTVAYSSYTQRNDKLLVNKTDEGITLSFSPDAGGTWCLFGATNTIDITDFSKFCCEIQAPNSSNSLYADIGMKPTVKQCDFLPTNSVGPARIVDSGVSSFTTKGIHECDISTNTGNAFPAIEFTSSSTSGFQTVNIYKVWLER